MFGRSGQMFPRRTFHDAIYEEEYGSDNEDECCRCRGLSAILCWFLSVIILVGLAATVVLTVFFILRSRTMMVKPNADVDVEMYGKDQNLYDSGGTSKEMIGSNESFVEIGKLKKGGKSGRGQDTTKNDVDANVNEEQNAILDSVQVDQAEDASVSHPRNHNTNNNRHNRLQPYSTTTTTTTEAPVPSEEEETSSEEIENDQNNEEGSSLFNLFSGPRNPSYNTPHNQDEDEFVSKESTIRHGHHGLISAESSETRYRDGSPVQQVLFTESPKVTVTTPNPYNNRRNLQTTRFPTGRTSFSTTTTTMAPPEESNEEEENNADHTDNEDEHTTNNKHDNDEDDGGDDNDEDDEDHAEDDQTNEKTNHNETEEINDEDKQDGNKDVHEESSEEVSAGGIEINKTRSSTLALQTTTSAYDAISEEESESEMGSQSGESQLKQMLLDEIPPHKKDEEQKLSSEDADGNVSSSQEFNLEQAVTLTTTARPPTTTKATKLLKTRQNTLTRIISRNFTRQGTTSTTTTSDGGAAVSATTESSISTPSVTTLGPAGHKYDYTMTPYERTKMKVKSVESTEQEVVVTKPPPKSRYRSTTPKGNVVVTPEPPSTAAPRTRGTTTPSTSDEYGVKLGGQRGSVESPIDIVPSPDLSPKGQQVNSAEVPDLASASSEESKTSEQFLDVLVGSEDHKTLVTKKTDDGIVTSAILPPWYDTNGPINSSISEVLATNGTTISNTVAKVEDEEGSGVGSNFGERTNPLKSSEEKQQLLAEKSISKEEGGSEFERLVNIFSKQQSSSEEVPQRFGYKKVKQVQVLKKPVPGLLAQGSRYIPQVPGRANLYPASGESGTSKESSNPTMSSEKKSSTAPWVSENYQMNGNGNSEHSGDVSRTGVLPTSEVEPEDMPTSYYPEDPANSDKIVEQHLVESERLSSDEMADSMMMEPVPPSHVIDVNFEEADNPQEIIIEQDSSAPVEDGDFEGDDYAYGEHPPTMSMAGSTPNQHVVAAPEEFVRGSGIRKPVSSEEETENDLEGSGSSPVENNSTISTTTTTTTTSPPSQVPPSSPPVVIRRPAYTREEIAKSVVKPSPESLAAVVDSSNNNLQTEHDGVAEATGSDEFEEYEDDNYEDGSVEHQGAGSSVEQWSIEKSDAGQKWSAPDKILDAAPNNPQQYASEEFEEHQSAEGQSKQVDITKNLNTVDNTAPGNDSTSQIETASDNSTSTIFKPPALVSFHENKLSFFPPVQAEGEYHSKDGWRPVISGPAHNPPSPPSDSPTDPYYNAGVSQEPDSGQAGSFESAEQAEGEPQHESQFQELPSPQQQLQQDPKQQWPTAVAAIVESNVQLEAQGSNNGKLKPSPMIPPPIPANVKFPDSEEDHEDRHHHVRHKPRQQLPINNFDRAKYMVRPVPPPIVMRRHPHSNGPYPPPPPPQVPHNRQPPPPRPQMIPQASQPNPQFSEQHPQARPPLPPHINRNFHMRPNMPMRRFNFGPPQAQPRSGGNIKWPSDNKDSSNENSKNNSEQNIEKIASQSEIPTINRRRRRRRGIA